MKGLDDTVEPLTEQAQETHFNGEFSINRMLGFTPRWENDPGRLSAALDSLTRRKRRRSQQPFTLKESPVDTMADQCTMAELLRAPTEGTINLCNEISNFQQRFDESFHEAWDRYKDLLCACPYHGFTELHQLDTFYNALNPADQDSLNAAAGGNLLERRTQDVLTIIENKSKVRNSRSKSVVSQVKASILKQFQATPPPASVKAVEETCVTCDGAHPYYQCLAAGGNTFPELRDNIQGYFSAAAVQYNQGNPGYRPLRVANQIRPPGSGSLPSNTIANLKGKLKAITTRSGLVINGPIIPTPPKSINPEVDECVEETFTDPNLVEYTIKVPPPFVPKYKPPSQREFVVHQRDPLHPNIPYPSRMLKQKQQEKDEVQIYKFWQMFKQLHINITLADALILMPNDPRVPLILGRPFLRTARALIDVHGEEMILRDEEDNVLSKKLLDLDSTKDLHPPLHEDTLSGSTTLSSNPLLEEFTDKLAFLLKYDDDLQFDIKSDLKEIEFLLYQDIDSSLKDLIEHHADHVVNSMPEMFTNEHALDYSSPPIFDEYDDDFLEIESDVENVYDDPFNSKGEKIKESKLLIDKLDLPCDFLPFEYDSFISQDFSRVDALPLTNNEDKIFNPGILIQEKYLEIITRVVQDKKLATSNASLMLEDFDPPFYEPLFIKEVPSSKMLLPFSSKNEEKVFKPGTHTSEKVHSSFILELSHPDYIIFKINQIFKSPMKILLFFCGKDTHTLAVPCLHFYPLDQLKCGGH
nr:reverse transcriptase domain-containing protein [Tanacetum cinerariifolium]